MKTLLASLCVLVLAAVVRGGGLPAEPAIDGHLTNARIAKSADGKHEYFVPGENVLEFVWSDEPIVAHVPFVVDAPEGEAVWILISVGFDGFSADGKGALHGKPEIRWNAGGPGGPRPAVGLTRRDGTVWHDGIRLVGEEPDRLVREPGEGSPVAPWRDVEGGKPAGVNWLRLRRIPPEESTVKRAPRMRLFFPPDAPRGAYTLWFVVPAGHVWASRPFVQPDEITGEFRATVFSIQQTGEPGYHELMVAAGQRPQAGPNDPNLSRWKRLPDVRVPVTCRKNGWVLDKTF
ncbi:MAG: hypothetical protein GY704_16810, partial [Phycisphaeraceae bacterium]|nr:hypothetical protein [Phycisphaeraceae bacterium]